MGKDLFSNPTLYGFNTTGWLCVSHYYLQSTVIAPNANASILESTDHPATTEISNRPFLKQEILNALLATEIKNPAQTGFI